MPGTMLLLHPDQHDAAAADPRVDAAKNAEQKKPKP